MEKFMEIELRKLSAEARLLAACFITALLVGYGVSILKAVEKSDFSSANVVRQYRGDADPEAMAFPKPYEDILQNTHAHALSVPVVYFLLSALFLGTPLGSRAKKACVTALFCGFFLEFAALWGLRYAHEGLVYAVFFAHAVTGPVYLFMCSRILFDLARG
jgi:hypothetical protein